MDSVTPNYFISELLAFRELMGDRRFWARPADQRQIAIKAFGLVYFNTDPLTETVTNQFEATMREYVIRESMMTRDGMIA